MAKVFTKIRKDNAKDNYFAFIHTFFENMYYNTFNIYVLEGIMWLYRGKDDLTKEIDEYYHSKGDYSHDEDSWLLGEEGKAHDKHSLGYEIAEAENKKYVDHSKHSFSEEVAESDKSRRRKSGTDLGDMLIDSIEKRAQSGKKSRAASRNVFTQNRNSYNYGYNTSRQRRTGGRRSTPFVAVFIMLVFFIIFVAMMITGLGAVRQVNRPDYSYTEAEVVTNEYFNLDDYGDIRRSYPDYDFSQVDVIAELAEEDPVFVTLENYNILSSVWCEISGDNVYWYMDMFDSGESADRERIAVAVATLSDAVEEYGLSDTEINVYVYNDNYTHYFVVTEDSRCNFLDVFTRLNEV